MSYLHYKRWKAFKLAVALIGKNKEMKMNIVHIPKVTAHEMAIIMNNLIRGIDYKGSLKTDLCKTLESVSNGTCIHDIKQEIGERVISQLYKLNSFKENQSEQLGQFINVLRSF